MELNHYFDAVDFSAYAKESPVAWRFSLGATIQKNTTKLNSTNLSNVEVALVGVPFETRNNESVITNVPDQIRKELYRLANRKKLNIVDFGNLKKAQSTKGNFLALRDITDYLNELNIKTIILGGSQDFSYGICQAFSTNKLFSFCTIDAQLDIKKGREVSTPENYLSKVFSKIPNLFQFSLLGYQTHYVPDEYFPKLKGIGQHIRLGMLRQKLTLAEPVFRNSDFLSIDFSTLKYSDSYGYRKLPNGLQNEEICQLAKYAGLSARLQVFGLFGIVNETFNAEITFKLAAQVIYYYLEGFQDQSKMHPSNNEGFNEYKVEITEVDGPVIFYKNDETGQWWIEVKSLDNQIVYLACNEQDYEDAIHNEIPIFWLDYIQKIDEILK